MNSLYYQNIVNRLEKEIADLQTRIATESKKEVDKNRQIDLVSKHSIFRLDTHVS